MKEFIVRFDEKEKTWKAYNTDEKLLSCNFCSTNRVKDEDDKDLCALIALANALGYDGEIIGNWLGLW